MKATNRILQILTALGAIAAGLFYFASESGERVTREQLEQLASENRLQRDRSKRLQEELLELESTRSQSESELEKLGAETALAQNQLLQLRRENQRLLQQLAAQEEAEQRLQRENSRLAQQISELKANTVSREQVAAFESQIAALERENLELQQTRADSARLKGPLHATIPANPTLKGNVLTVGKGASFVVIDIGYNHGVRLQNELFVQHADTPIAKIQVTEVKENLSIARVLPDSILKRPQSGDSVASPN